MSMSLADRLSFYARAVWVSARRQKVNRDTQAVSTEYDHGWEEYRKYLRSCESISDWLCIPGVEDAPAHYLVDGHVAYEKFHSGGFYRDTLLQTLRENFPGATSITEYGCGVGRNVLFLREELGIKGYGYELCQPGVEVATEAAQKFGLDAKYAQLDYLNDAPEKFVFPATDVAFTMFSLEQIPRRSEVALQNILRRVKLGAIHIEPVPERYPWSLRGTLGRLEHWKVDYLSGFDASVRRLSLKSVKVRRLRSAHNPLMSPSVYVLIK